MEREKLWHFIQKYGQARQALGRAIVDPDYSAEDKQEIKEELSAIRKILLEIVWSK